MLTGAVLVGVHLRHHLADARLGQYLRAAWAAVIDVITGPVLAARDVDWPRSATSERSRGPVAVGLGTAMAIPVVLVFGSLLASADPVIDAFVARLFHWNIQTPLEHLALASVMGWLAAGALWGMAAARSQREPETQPQPGNARQTMPRRTLGILELGIPLGTLLVMLVSFVGLQARYLFGGENVIELTGMTYAELARRGFFELVTVSALVAPILLASQHVLDRRRQTAVESFRALVIALLVVVLLVMVSAVARMRLYVQSYGLTEDRLYASAFMGWAGFVLVWLAWTEVRGQLSRFATGAVLAGFGVLAALNVVNPDGLVARTNIARAERGLALDVDYLNRLSSDAVPAVAGRWASLDADARVALRNGLMSMDGPPGWRAWTWSRMQSERAVADLPPDGLPAGIDRPE